MATAVVLTSTSPYGSRRLTVERDQVSSVAYLRDQAGAVHGAVWLANHVPAPVSVDRGRLAAGLPPIMPGTHTRHPQGSDPSDPARLRVLWFEEGDGAALYEDGELLAVIPGWAEVERGMPGYARDAVGESPFAWSLTDALDGLEPRIRKAEAYWQWRESDGNWASYQQFVMGHLDSRIGPPGRYWDASGGGLPRIEITERPPLFGRNYTILSTVGMSCQRLPGAEQYDTPTRIELAIATRGDPRAAARLFLWLGQYPWRSVTWLGHGHTARWRHQPGTFPLNGGHEGVILLAQPGGLPDLSGFAFGGDEVRWLWLVPITDTELRVAADRGHEVVSSRLAVQDRI
ncbi:suppressor of fused domain protein [Acrocarpospora catenulata]|uniref:suppressor of fused domain protein n=1 Tax=Acrocarpospora catenulata TaxID=2836182 RepID=UPI0027DF4F52|nr:suppressor of fused domain protein [Acrocarpospora catenulata]